MPEIAPAQPPANKPALKTLRVQQKALAFTSSLTFREFLEKSPTIAPLLRGRYQEVRIPLAEQTFLLTYPDILNFIVIVNEESPDTLVVLPILVRMAAASPHFWLGILRDTDDLSMVDALIDEIDFAEDLGDLDLPLLLVFDEEWNFQGQWGPHPQEAERYLEEWFENHPEYAKLAEGETLIAQKTYATLLNQLTHEMRAWYNSDLNRACFLEIRELLAGLLEETEADEQDS
ncbi:MAG: thioredoxin family protein [Chloroflexi bacterium]|nr:thioredoxin family protein [Chloroflexota bacterium]